MLTKPNRGSLCTRFAQILRSTILESSPDICAITHVRSIGPTIAGMSTSNLQS